MKIPFIVTLSHLLIILSVVYLQPLAPKSIPHKPVAVRTYVQKFEPQPPPKFLKLDQPISLLVDPLPEEEALAAAPSPPPEAPKPVPSKPATPKPAAPKPASKPPAKPTASKNPQPKTHPNQQKLISMMQQSLHKLNATEGSSQGGGSTKATGKTIGSLASETLSFEAKYEEELILYLETLLSFPEKGEVKVKLTLKKEGSVQKVDIIHATNERNRKYIESTLTTCSFPPFGSRFKGETSHTFTITLTSHSR